MKLFKNHPTAMILAGLACLCAALIIAAVEYDQSSPEQGDRVQASENGDGPGARLRFFREGRADICFAHHQERSGRCVSIVPCWIVERRLDPLYEVLGQSIWYYQDMRDGQCFALGPIHGNDFSFLVDCDKVGHLLGPPRGRWRTDKRLR